MDLQELKAHTEKLRRVARVAHEHRVPFGHIRSERHRNALDRAIKNVLSTELAQFTYAQIMDVLPTGDVCFERRYPGVFGEHPIDSDHEELCPGAMERAHKYCEQWNPEILMFDQKVIAGYQLAEFGSKAFSVRLVELAAVTLHQVRALLFQLDLRIHQGGTDSIVNWRMPTIEGLVDVPPQPTLFNHHAYLDADIYPAGVADIVGHWAEDRILGGVAVFDRGTEDVAATPNIYFHSCRRRQTHRVHQLLDDQQEALFDFLLAETDSPPPAPNPLPVLSNAQNRIRVDSEFAITHHNIYRDIWERKPLTMEEELTMERRPKSDIDYPELAEEVFQINKQPGIPLPGLRERSPSF